MSFHKFGKHHFEEGNGTGPQITPRAELTEHPRNFSRKHGRRSSWRLSSMLQKESMAEAEVLHFVCKPTNSLKEA